MASYFGVYVFNILIFSSTVFAFTDLQSKVGIWV